MCTFRTGQLLNLSALAADCGITHNTAKSWLSILESSGIIYLLRPYYKNYGKRLVKTPKLYFLDTGIACRLLGIQSAEELFPHPNRGNIFESLIISELLKARLNIGLTPDIYFWRDSSGLEVDVIIENAGKLNAIEIKSGKTFSPNLLDGLQSWMQISGEKPENCAIAYAGEMRFKHNGVDIISWEKI